MVLFNPLPGLENGDRLPRPEFERRYSAMPSLKKAELIEGVVYMPSPVRAGRHARPHARVMAWLSVYWTGTPGVDLCDNPTVRLDMENEPQPDAVLRLEGGQSYVTEDDYIAGAPEMVVEISASSVSIDLNDKLRAYRRNGVQEYFVWKVEEQAIAWYELVEGQYVTLLPQRIENRSVTCSRAFPGLWLDTSALLTGDMTTVLVGLQRGMQSVEYQEFQASLQV